MMRGQGVLAAGSATGGVRVVVVAAVRGLVAIAGVGVRVVIGPGPMVRWLRMG